MPISVAHLSGNDIGFALSEVGRLPMEILSPVTLRLTIADDVRQLVPRGECELTYVSQRRGVLHIFRNVRAIGRNIGDVSYIYIVWNGGNYSAGNRRWTGLETLQHSLRRGLYPSRL